MEMVEESSENEGRVSGAKLNKLNYDPSYRAREREQRAERAEVSLSLFYLYFYSSSLVSLSFYYSSSFPPSIPFHSFLILSLCFLLLLSYTTSTINFYYYFLRPNE
ncbi:hypothetical protein RIF29_23861 [Crotalaria pallida]|uniref:Uncharacterized protein n=1 Tax=Crotalaria pallida TaxID=3830 RepID=A0AAN9EQT5_CROPI